MFWKKTSVGNAAGDDERFIDGRDWFREMMLFLFLLLFL